MIYPALSQQIIKPDSTQYALTQHYLHDTQAIFDYFLALRLEIDPIMEKRYPQAAGKAYPYGRCEEITRYLYEQLNKRLAEPTHPVEHQLRSFAANGGVMRTIWGVLRTQYFQNAIQCGALYIDVSNDTVFVTKPKIEILPIEESGLEAIQNLAHFRETAQRYWNSELYVNYLVPSLAPLLPMISYSPGKLSPGFQSACDYMIEWMCRDEFKEAETWLCEGTPLPDSLYQYMLPSIPADLSPWTNNPKMEAILACQRARTAQCGKDIRWRNARTLDYLRLMGSFK